jgi:hypothetical protein
VFALRYLSRRRKVFASVAQEIEFNQRLHIAPAWRCGAAPMRRMVPQENQASQTSIEDTKTVLQNHSAHLEKFDGTRRYWRRRHIIPKRWARNTISSAG